MPVFSPGDEIRYSGNRGVIKHVKPAVYVTERLGTGEKTIIDLVPVWIARRPV